MTHCRVGCQNLRELHILLLILLLCGWRLPNVLCAGAPPAPAPAPLDPDQVGEDIGEGGEDPASLAIRNAARQMLQAQRLLTQRRTSRETQRLQATATAELQRLIADLETKSSAKASGGDSPQDAAGGEKSNAAQEQPPPDARPEESSDGAGEAGTRQPTEAKIWGHLPQRLRQRMRTAGVEEFLPQYEQMLEDFYRRLGEGP